MGTAVTLSSASCATTASLAALRSELRLQSESGSSSFAFSQQCNQQICRSKLGPSSPLVRPQHFILDLRTWENYRLKRSFVCANATAEKEALPQTFEFLDEGDSVEVRVPLGCNKNGLKRNQLAINTYEDSLLVTLATEDALLPLLVANPLYANVSPSDTVWFLDEEEIVINMRKVNKNLNWPDLIEATSSLGRGVGSMLKSCSINVVGESSEANWKLAKELSLLLEYVPISTQQLVETAIGRSVDSVREEEGDAGVAEAESAMLEGLTSNVRCVVGTMGYGDSAFPSNNVRFLHSGVTVYLESQSQSNSSDTVTSPTENEAGPSNQESRFSWADVRIRTESPADKWEEDDTRKVAKSSLQAIKKLLENDTELTGKKGLYLRLGCRGDWPEIMPPGWNPNSPKK